MVAGKLDKLARVAEIAEQASARDLSASASSHRSNTEQLDQLLQYREEYEATLRVKYERGVSAAEMQDYRAFLGKLDQAIEEQREQVAASGESLQGVEAVYRDKSQRKQALDHLVDQRLKVALRAREKAEQRSSDERATARPPQDFGDDFGM